MIEQETIERKEMLEDDEIEISKEEKEKDIITPKNLEDVFRQVSDKLERARMFIEIIPCYYDHARNWWMWNHKEKRWKITDETDIINAINSQATTNLINSRERTEMLEALRQVARMNEPKEIKKTWVQFDDEIIDIIKGDIIKATPEYFVTNPIPYKLHPEHFFLTPTIDNLFEEWVGKENVQKLYEILAYCMLPDYPLHRIFCLIGAGMNGKSCFLTLLKKFVGSYNCCSTELDGLINNRFEVTRLHKKLVAIMGETNFNEMSKTSMLKKLSGGDLIGFEYKNKDLFDAVNYAKLLIATNNLPTTTDKSIGFYRRWMIIDFPNMFSERKDILSTIPEDEYMSLALKCSMILRDLLIKREFTNEGTIEQRMERYESKSNFLESFIKEFIEESDSFITKLEFKSRFDSWCKENRHRELSESSIGKEMKKRGIETGKRSFDWVTDGKHGRFHVWEGVKWVE